ncbi:MAG: alpha/beta hydrolase [Christensenellaceae bacterium]|jgi:pimeloyl-ACP methyl ester carboxylesterase|nr:alpha/beta hydrolase [Christensenellaceae bacterium]
MHGWGCDSKNLENVASILSHEFRVTLVDFYGFGKTPHPERVLKIEDYADSIIAIISNYKMINITLLGHSFGSRIAIFLAAKYPAFFKNIILLNPAGIKPFYGPIHYFKINLFKLIRALNLPIASFGSTDYLNLKGYKRDSFKNIVTFHLNKFLHKITIPTLIIAGKNDKVIKLYMVRKLTRMIKHAKCIVIDNASHFCHLERPNETLSVIKEFLGGSNDY